MLLDLAATHAAVLLVLLLGTPEPIRGAPMGSTPTPPAPTPPTPAPVRFGALSYPNAPNECDSVVVVDVISQQEWDAISVGALFTSRTTPNGGCWRRQKSSSTPLDATFPDGGPFCTDVPGQTLEFFYASSCSRAGDSSPEPLVGVAGGAGVIDGQPARRQLAEGALPFEPRLVEGEHNVEPHLVDGALPVKPGDTAYDKYATTCANVDYEGSLVIENDHFYVVGSPKNDASDSCPYVASHAVFKGPEVEASDALYVKEVLIWNTNQGKHLKKFLQDSLPLGTYKLSDVKRAHDSIDPSKRSRNHKFYDVINFNCVDFVMALASAMNVKIDSKMTSYVARRLLEESGKNLVDTIRKSSSFLSLFPGRNLRADKTEDITDEQVVYALVDKHASDGVLLG